MGSSVLVPPPTREAPPRGGPPPRPPLSPVRFSSLVPQEAVSVAGKRSLTFGLSLVLHGGLVVAMLVLPLVLYDQVPVPVDRLTRAFFAEPLEIAPPPPPPPPPPAAVRRTVAPRPAPAPVVDTGALVAPVEIPDTLPVPEEGLDLGIAGGVPGGVEGGVPGGVVGGVVGGLPAEVTPPPPPKVVRVGGSLTAPAIVRRVNPVYPEIAQAARVQGVVILEARVDTRGRVTNVEVLRGHPLLDEAAVEAVRKWRYRPLLLNGEPTEFILTVTVNFELK